MKKKVISLIGILWACLCVVFVIIILKYNVKGIINSVFPPEEIQELNLTEEEKLEDFNFFFNTVTSSMPMINEYDSVYGFNITERKDYYQEMVKSTKNDYEFYCVMVALTQEIPSFHTDLVYPDSINTLHCYNSKKYLQIELSFRIIVIGQILLKIILTLHATIMYSLMLMVNIYLIG